MDQTSQQPQKSQIPPVKARTIVLDTARLIKENKISKEELAKMDKTFRNEVMSYLSSMTDDDHGEITLKKKEIPLPPPIKKIVAPDPEPQPQPQPIPKPVPPKPVEKPKPVPPPPPTAKPEPKPEPKTEKLTGEQLLYAHQEQIQTRKNSVNEILREIQLERNTLLQQLESVRGKERAVEKEEHNIKSQEKEASTLEIKALEEKRWVLEDQRQLFEKERFETHRKIDEVDVKISAQNRELHAFDREEKEVKKEIEKFILQRDAARAKEDKAQEEKVYAAIEAKKKKFELQWISMKEYIKHTKERIAKTDSEALDLKKQIEELEHAESSASNEKDRHAVEEKRWDLDKRFREIEKSVWQLDAEIEQKTKEIEDIEKLFAEIQIEEETSKEKINTYNMTIKKAESL